MTSEPIRATVTKAKAETPEPLAMTLWLVWVWRQNSSWCKDTQWSDCQWAEERAEQIIQDGTPPNWVRIVRIDLPGDSP